jgi:hypothetical protein
MSVATAIPHDGSDEDLGQSGCAPAAEGAKSAWCAYRSETIRKALDIVTEKAAHDRVVCRYSGAGRPDAFSED